MRSKAHPGGRREAAGAERWRRGDYTHDDLAEGLVDGHIAGRVLSHDRANVLWKIERFADGDPLGQFGISGLGSLSAGEVLRLMAEAAGFDAFAGDADGGLEVDPARVLAKLEEAGDRLAMAAARGERVLLATGHPVGLILLYMAIGDLVLDHGGSLIRPLDGDRWREDGHWRQVRYLHGVAVLTDRGSSMHSHESGPMERMLEDAAHEDGLPDLVLADHGFAGAAIEAGIDTISVADVNDPAPVAAVALGRTRTVIVMDDNVEPEAYWPCFQAIGSRFPS
jgi:hypothetical protein